MDMIILKKIFKTQRKTKRIKEKQPNNNNNKQQKKKWKEKSFHHFIKQSPESRKTFQQQQVVKPICISTFYLSIFSCMKSI